MQFRFHDQYPKVCSHQQAFLPVNRPRVYPTNTPPAFWWITRCARRFCVNTPAAGHIWYRWRWRIIVFVGKLHHRHNWARISCWTCGIESSQSTNTVGITKLPFKTVVCRASNRPSTKGLRQTASPAQSRQRTFERCSLEINAPIWVSISIGLPMISFSVRVLSWSMKSL